MRNRVRAQVRAERKKRRALFSALLGVLLAYLLANFFLGDMGYLSYRRLVGVRERLREEVREIEARNETLRAEIEALKSDPETIEKHAREDLGLGRKDELIFHFERDPAGE